jgi:hypothetical protein
MAKHTKEVRLQYMDGLSRRGHSRSLLKSLKHIKIVGERH